MTHEELLQIDCSDTEVTALHTQTVSDTKLQKRAYALIKWWPTESTLSSDMQGARRRHAAMHAYEVAEPWGLVSHLYGLHSMSTHAHPVAYDSEKDYEIIQKLSI